jgi:sulfate-transporting ATPase
MAAYQYIYTMKDLRKVFPNGKEVLKGIYLSFYPGAKIGIIGGNGAGKSTVLRIMAGLDKDFVGEAWLAKGYTVGYLPAGARARPHPRRHRQRAPGPGPHPEPARRLQQDLRAELGEPDADFDACSGEAGQAAGPDRRPRRLGSRQPPGEWPWTPCAARPATPTWPRCPAARSAGWRCAACCCRSPTCCCSTSPPTTSTPSRWPGWRPTSRATTAPSWLVTHDRYFLDNVAGVDPGAGERPGPALEGQLFQWLEQKGEKLRTKEKAESNRQRALSEELDWIRRGPRGARPRARRASRPSSSCRTSRARSASSASSCASPCPRSGSGTLVVEATEAPQGLRRPAALRRPELQDPPGGHRRRHRPQRRRQDHPVSHDHRPGEGRLRPPAGGPHRRPLLHQPGARRPGGRQDRSTRRSRAGRGHRDGQGRSSSTPGPTSATSTSRAATSRRSSASSRAVSATASTSPSC